MLDFVSFEVREGSCSDSTYSEKRNDFKIPIKEKGP